MSAATGLEPCQHFSDKGALQMRASALFGAKNFDILRFMVYPHGQGGRRVEPVRTFCRQRWEGSIFRDFVWTSFI